MINDIQLDIFYKAALSRHFENKVYEAIQNKLIQIPVYLSAGQEFIPASIATFMEKINIKPHIFPQHRMHHTYLSFGGNPTSLIRKLLGRENPMEGSASLQNKKINMIGHDGMVSSNTTIATGFCFASKKPTIAMFGDAAAEECYFLSSLGFSATHNVPILYVCEDNNLSILTEKKVRRSWDLISVARGFGISSFNVEDNPEDIIRVLNNVSNVLFKQPVLLNIMTNRKYWHAGAGQDGEPFDRYKDQIRMLGKEAEKTDLIAKEMVDKLWEEEC